MKNPSSQPAKMLIRMVLAWAGMNASVPNEAEIRKSLENLRPIVAATLPDSELEEVFDHLTRILNIEMDLGTVIEGARHVPWVERRRSEIDWQLWEAYVHYLSAQGRPPLVIDRLNKALDLLLDHIGDPAEQEAWDRRGLVIGDVQSGKTSTYIGLMDKAADAGYRIFIVLTGNTESLRRQTQERVDEGMIGRDSSAALLNVKTPLGDRDSRVGIGRLIESNASVASTTTVLTDFRKASAEAMNIVPGQGLSIVFITKKNKIVLDRIADWLENQKMGEQKLKLPMLFIDDEADYASINTNKSEEDPTAINQAIRRILATTSRNSYIGFTATPFANIFINDEDDTDLFPKDFIYALDSPSNYVGAATLFGSWDGIDDEESIDDTESLRILEDAEDVFPLSHKKLLAVESLPESLLEALRTFLVANAIRDLRGDADNSRSMLVNVSRFNLVQQRVGELLEEELAGYRNAINSHHITFARGVPNGELESLKTTFFEEFGDQEIGWPDILAQLPSAVAKIEVAIANSQRDKELERQQIKDQISRRRISVGGDLLSRGLTLEGLVVSYFYRRTAASDTLMQMGRWFGYRDGYSDLFRIWLSAEVISSYASTADSLLDLRLELDRMQSQGLTPAQYGLAVKNHPGALLITARNKMRSAEVGQKSISLRGNPIESASLSTDTNTARANLSAAGALLTSVAGAGINKEDAGGQRKIWREVPKTFVADFLRDFKASDSSALFFGDALSKFARGAQAEDLQSWDVVLMGGEAPDILIGDMKASRSERKVRRQGDTWLISSQRRRVAGRGDVAIPLGNERIRSIRENYQSLTEKKGAQPPDKVFVEYLDRPVLLLYPIQGKVVSGPDRRHEVETGEKVPETLLAVVLAVPGASVSNRDSDTVTYMLNAVAKRLWVQEFESSDEDEDDDDDVG